MRMQRNFYEVLGVQRNATQEEIKAKYLNLARQYHPDRAKDKEIANRLFVQINRAYSTLSSQTRRAQYDATLIATSNIQMRPPAGTVSTTATNPQTTTPQQVREWFDQASRLQMKGEYAKGLELCMKVIQHEPNNFPGLLLTGDLLAQTGKEQEAIAIYERASILQPNNRLLREKISRLSGLMARRTTGSIPADRRAPGNITPPHSSNGNTSSSEPAQRSNADQANQPSQKSFLDRLIHRK